MFLELRLHVRQRSAKLSLYHQLQIVALFADPPFNSTRKIDRLQTQSADIRNLFASGTSLLQRLLTQARR
jgi:hypothetical protein